MTATPRFARWIPRVISGAFAATAWIALAGPAPVAPFALEIDLASSTDGRLQVFYDRGAGIRDTDSVVIPIQQSGRPSTYRLPLPAGHYRMFRIDPNDRPGDYILTQLRLTTAEGDPVAPFDLSQLRPVAPTTLAVAGGTVTAHVPNGVADPQLIYETSVSLTPTLRQRAKAVLPWVPAAVLGLLAAWLLDRRSFGPLQARVTSALAHAPTKAIAITGVIATLVATYPLFFGRSLVSPNNGGTFLFYDEPPYTYGSNDFAVEDARGTDIGSMMWAILPYSELQRDALAAGEFPLWNRYNSVGRPLWGQAQHFFLEPIHFAALAIPDAASRADAVFVSARAAFAVGAGLATFMATRSVPAAMLVTASAPFIGHFTYRFNHPAYFSIVYAPWMLWGYFRLTQRQGWHELTRGATVLAAFSALQLVGSTPKEGVVVWVVTHVVGVATLVFSGGSSTDRVRRVALAALAGVLALALTIPHWLIFLDTLTRAYTLYDVPTADFASWNQIPAAMSLGPLLPGRPYPSVNGLLAVLALATLASPVRLWRQPAALACILGVGLSLSIACGVLPASVVTKLPLLANVHQIWNVFLTAALVPLLILAGAGVVLLHETPRKGIAAAAGATFLLVWTIDAAFPPFFPGLTAIKIASFLPALSVGLLLACVVSFSSAVTYVLLAIGLAVALLPGGLHFETGNPRLDQLLIQPRPRVALDIDPPAVRAARAHGIEPFRVASLENVLFAGTQGYYRLEGITGPDALSLREESELLDAAGIARSLWRPVLRQQDLTNARGLLDMLGVRFVFGRGYHLPSNTPRLAAGEADPVDVVERRSAWPRAFFVDGVRRHPNLQSLVASFEAARGPFASIDSADRLALDAVGTLNTQETHHVPARDYVLTPNRTSFVIDAPDRGAIVLSEAFVPHDFGATLNGQRVDYFKVNHALKGVVIPGAGTWTVAFEYRPRRWLVSWVVCLVALVAIAALVLGGRRRS